MSRITLANVNSRANCLDKIIHQILPNGNAKINVSAGTKWEDPSANAQGVGAVSLYQHLFPCDTQTAILTIAELTGMENGFDLVPDSLKSLPQWLLWKLETRQGKATKVPYMPNGRHAKSNDPATWSPFATVLNAVGKFSGIGFAFSSSDGLIGIDVDYPVDTLICADIIEHFQDTYCEISPSGKLRIFCRGNIPRCGKGDLDKLIEVYNHTSPRYLTVTGDWIKETSREIMPCQDALDWLFGKFFSGAGIANQPVLAPAKNAQPQPVGQHDNSLSNEDIISIIRRSKSSAKFENLFGGGGPQDQSSGDLSLAKIFAFYTHSPSGGGMSQLDSLMRMSSRANMSNGKWDKKHSADGRTYGQITLDKCVSSVSVCYSPKDIPKTKSPQKSKKVEHERELAQPKFELTQYGNTLRFANLHGHDVRFCHKHENWLLWDGTRWEVDETRQVMKLALDVVKDLKEESKTFLKIDRELSSEISLYANKTANANALTGMLFLAGCEGVTGMAVVPSQLDANPWTLNVLNGTIDLRTGTLLPHVRSDLNTKRLPFNFNNSAACPTWERFLNDVTGGDRELQSNLQQAVGYSLTGSTREQCFFFLYGTGSNGKSTFTAIVEELLGLGEYASRVPAATLMRAQDKDKKIPNDLARLAGARLVLSAEIAENSAIDEAFIKDATGGDTITARFLNKEFFDYTPQFKIWMYGNHKPRITGTDQGIRRRVRLIPFNQTFSGEKKDPHLLEKLKSEIEGILQWAVQGCLAWQKDGLQSAQAVTLATEEYFHEMDLVSLFIDECCEINSSAKIPSKALYEAYKAWFISSGYKGGLKNQKQFGEELEKRGFQSVRGAKGVRVRSGLTLLTTEEEGDAGDATVTREISRVTPQTEETRGFEVGSDASDARKEVTAHEEKAKHAHTDNVIPVYVSSNSESHVTRVTNSEKVNNFKWLEGDARKKVTSPSRHSCHPVRPGGIEKSIDDVIGIAEYWDKARLDRTEVEAFFDHCRDPFTAVANLHSARSKWGNKPNFDWLNELGKAILSCQP